MSLRFLLLALLVVPSPLFAGELRIGTFEIDATPEVGSPLAYDPMKEATEPLSCKGIVILGDEAPVVLCAVDWLGIANQANETFCESLAQAVGTSVDRVVVHTLHQHDAPRCDLTSAKILDEVGHASVHFDVPFIQDVIQRAGQAAEAAKASVVSVTSISVGQAHVHDVASNRRMLGPDGRVHTTRYTACKDPKIRALPTGVIDPYLRTIVFNGNTGPIAALTFYATHPQSYYRTGGANPDFPGMARNSRQTQTGVFHLHFNGAGGNIGAGKFNDGARENRQILADKVSAAMRKAWDARQEQAIAAADVAWAATKVSLPVAEHLIEGSLVKLVADSSAQPAIRLNAAKKLAFLRRMNAGKQVPVSRLKLGDNYILFMPGELFVEYQLASQAMKPDSNVLMAAYGEYATGYIGTRTAYPQGGYEVSERASYVSPDAEAVLLAAMRQLLGVPKSRVLASDFTDTRGELPN